MQSTVPIDPLDPEVTEALRALRVQHSAGVALVETLQTCATCCARGPGGAAFIEASKRAASGEEIKRVLGALAPVLPEAERAILAAGWNSGRAEPAMDSVIQQRELWYLTRKKVNGKLLMPAGVLVLAAFVAPLPAFIAGATTMSGYLFTVIVPLLIGGLVWRSLNRSLRARALAKVADGGDPLPPDLFDQIMMMLPVVRDVERNRSIAETSSIMGYGLNAGMNLPAVLELCAGSARNGFYRLSAQRMADRTREGIPFTDALREEEARLWPPEFVSSIAVGEKSGALDAALLRMAAYGRERYMAAIEILGEMLPKVLYGLVSLFVIYNIFKLAGAYMSQVNELLPPN